MPILASFGIFFLVGIDQLIKLWAKTVLMNHDSISVIPGIFELRYLENRGAAFGILQDHRWIFIIITFGIICFALFLLFKGLLKSPWLLWPAVLIIAGGIGNLIDRVFSGFVIDMFYFSLIDFAIFNFADSCVVVGCILLIIGLLVKPELFSFKKVDEQDQTACKEKTDEEHSADCIDK